MLRNRGGEEGQGRGANARKRGEMGEKRVVERRDGEKTSPHARGREKVASLESEEVDGQPMEEEGENGVRGGGSWMFERTQFA